MNIKGCCGGLVVIAGVGALYNQIGPGWFWPIVAVLVAVIIASVATDGKKRKADNDRIKSALLAAPLGEGIPESIAKYVLSSLVLEPTDKGYDQEVAGESFYSENFELVAKEIKAGQGVWLPLIFALVADPKNEHDPNAVAVTAGGVVLGHIPRGDATDFHNFLMARSGIAQAKGQIRFNLDEGLNSVRLDIAKPIRGSLKLTKTAVETANRLKK